MRCIPAGSSDQGLHFLTFWQHSSCLSACNVAQNQAHTSMQSHPSERTCVTTMILNSRSQALSTCIGA